MDSSNLFSHPEAPEHVAEGHASAAAAKPVEYPQFSDRPDADGTTSRTQQT
jgi:hypothetical protein